MGERWPTGIRELDKHSLVTEIRELRNRLCGSVIREDKPNACREQPTMKPMDLIVSMLRNSSTRGDIVLDLCAGSGSTLIACEKLGRHARVMELDPHYCDVVIRRRESLQRKRGVKTNDTSRINRKSNLSTNTTSTYAFT